MNSKKGEFNLRGTRCLLRTDNEISLIDKAEADAFKLCKKQYLDTLLRSKGFSKYKTNAYVRRNQADVLECIELQKEINGSRTFTVNYALTPLFLKFHVIKILKILDSSIIYKQFLIRNNKQKEYEF